MRSIEAPRTERSDTRTLLAGLRPSGGTATGEGLAAALALLRRDGATGKGKRPPAAVILLSDGWDRGEPEQLADEMARLQRTAYQVIWLNPLAADPRYEPLTRGMKAAMPHVDRLLPGNSISSLEALAELMEEGTT